MKTLRGKRGPFAEQPFYRQDELEQISATALRKSGLYPESPGPIRVERFIEKHFSVSPVYDDLPEGVLGFTRFGSKGVEDIFVSNKLLEDGSKVAERRLNSTLAHEAGHGLLHSHLFVLEAFSTPLFGDAEVGNRVKVLCREEIVGNQSSNKYDGKWWEYQANKMIGTLLLPKSLVLSSLHPLVTTQGKLEQKVLPTTKREEAVKLLASVFEVNPIVARIRINDIYPLNNSGQLTF